MADRLGSTLIFQWPHTRTLIHPFIIFLHRSQVKGIMLHAIFKILHSTATQFFIYLGIERLKRENSIKKLT